MELFWVPQIKLASFGPVYAYVGLNSNELGGMAG